MEESIISDYANINKLNKNRHLRNLVGFWILGLCNNYPYVIMISAAFDLLKESPGNLTTEFPHSNETIAPNKSTKLCNPISTGAILLADILPSLIIKFLAPMITLGIQIRVILTVSLSAMSFIITSFEVTHWMTFTGVVCASLSSGLGEVTFLSFSSYFNKDVVSTWSSGTGGAGVIGALSYASLRHALNVRHTIQVMLIMPIAMAVTFWGLIVHPYPKPCTCSLSNCGGETKPMLSDSIDMTDETAKGQYQKKYTFYEKLNLVKPLLKYMVPLSLVYFAEYFINQGLMELLYFKNAANWLSHEDQYRWYQVDYQIGVLISRSSVNVLQIKRLWILPVLQMLNVIFLLFETFYSFLPSIWIVFVIILYEGLLGGSAYVNTFYKISQEISEEHKEFSMGIASLGDSIGIALAGVVALPVHHALCSIFDG